MFLDSELNCQLRTTACIRAKQAMQGHSSGVNVVTKNQLCLARWVESLLSVFGTAVINVIEYIGCYGGIFVGVLILYFGT